MPARAFDRPDRGVRRDRGPALSGLAPSVLAPPGAARPAHWPADLPLYRDLNLDQIIDAVVSGRDRYELRELFYAPLDDVAGIEYRHAVLRDLDGTELGEHVLAFAARMTRMRKYQEQAGQRGYPDETRRWLLAAASEYCAAIQEFAQRLSQAPVSSEGMAQLRAFLTGYVASTSFARLAADARRVEEALAGITYTVQVRGDRVRVGRYHEEPDYSQEVAATFEKFRQGVVRSYLAKFVDYEGLDHVQGQILERVARLFPDQFGALAAFCAHHADFVDPVVLAFDREVQFYLAYLDFLAPIRAAGLAVSYPRTGTDGKAEHASDTFDLALAAKLAAASEPVVTNDYRLDGPERMIVVSGPNQGGKTTFARTFGQLHYLAKLGLPVPGRDTVLLLCDAVYTHFERPENLHDLIGKLQDDLVRIRAILDEATPRSVVVLNEIFTSTTLQDAVFLSRQILGRLADLDALSVCVTFLDELSTLGPATVSMVSTVLPEDPATRTFKVVRRAADGRAYALAIAERYGLTYERLKTRLRDVAEPVS